MRILGAAQLLTKQSCLVRELLGVGAGVALFQLKRLIHPGPKWTKDSGSYRADARLPPGSSCLREVMRELTPLPSEASLATLKGPGHRGER